MNEVYSDNDLDGEDDNKADVDPNNRGSNVDDNDIDNIDFDLDDLNSKNDDDDDDNIHEWWDDNSGDGNLRVFDFNEVDVARHNETTHEDHEGSIGGPSFGNLSAG